ncbi:MAG: hypothetical protein ACTSUB_08715, partial [Candidatus Thorarchaeota archaeon]
MDFIIEEANSIEDYLLIWSESMKHFSFAQNPTPADYSMKEEYQELTEDFSKKSRLYLQAKLKGSVQIGGVLDVILNNEMAKFGVWQPSVPIEYRHLGIGRELVKHAFMILKETGIQRVFATLKYRTPFEPEWHKTLYNDVGFEATEHEGVQLLVDLAETGDLPNPTFSGEIKTGEDFSLEEISELTVRSFGTSPGDQEIHRGSSMDDYETVLTIHQRIRDGVWGSSPADLWKMAFVDGELAGLIIGFLRESQFRTSTGFIGELGVSP